MQQVSAGPSAAISLQPPKPFDFSKPQEWGKWIRRFRIASNLNASSEANQINTLIYCMGDEADEVMHGLSIRADREMASKRVS